MASEQPQARKPVSRRYRMRRVATGDYLLWSNDGKTLWRIVSGIEGKSVGLVGARGDWVEWSVLRWPREHPPMSSDDFDTLERWREVSSGFRKRQDAVDWALGYQPAPLPADPRPKPSVQDAIRSMVAS